MDTVVVSESVHSRPEQITWTSWVNVGLGVWLVVAAFLFPHATGSGVTEDVIAGLLVALTALWSACAFRPTMSLVASGTVLLSGAWVIIAPFVLAYVRASVAVADDLLVGVAVVVLSALELRVRARLAESSI